MNNPSNPISTGLNDPKIISMIAYITLMGWFIALILNNPKNEQASFHIRQALGVNLVFMAGSILFIIPILGWIAGTACYITSFIFWFYGFSLAWEGDQQEVPILGKYFQQWFQGL